MVRHGQAAIVVGSRAPAMSISYAPVVGRGDVEFVVFYSEYDPTLEDDPTPDRVMCVGCLLDDGDVQLARGLDLAGLHGQVDYDAAQGEWFVP